MFLNTCHSSFGLSNRFFNLKDLLVVRKFTVSPQYSCLSRILDTVSATHPNGTAGGLLHFLSMLFQYSVGVITFSALSSFAICVGPSPEIQRSNILRTTFVAGSSTIHCSLSSEDFIYPKGGFVVKCFPDIPLLCITLRTLSLVFFACHSLNKSCIGTISLMPFAVSILSIMAI